MAVRQVAARSDAGSRSPATDAILNMRPDGIFALADSQGLLGVGDLAASAAVGALQRRAGEVRGAAQAIANDPTTEHRLELVQILESIYGDADAAVRRVAEKESKAGIVASMVAVVIAGTFAYVANVGNARAYLLRGGRLRLLTKDHTFAMLRLRQGVRTVDEVRGGTVDTRLYRSLGGGSELDVDTLELALADGDLLMLCSDGVHVNAEDGDLRPAFDADEMKAMADGVVEAARRTGSFDTASVLLLRFQARQEASEADRMAEVLASVFLFKKLPPDERMMIAPYLSTKRLHAGHVLFEEGEPGHTFFVVVKGKIRISKGDTHLTDVGPGGHFGELCLARPVERSATATAVADTVLFGLSRVRFKDLTHRRPSIGATLYEELMDDVGNRLRDLSDRLMLVEGLARGLVEPPAGIDLRKAIIQAAHGELGKT